MRVENEEEDNEEYKHRMEFDSDKPASSFTLSYYSAYLQSPKKKNGIGKP